MYGYIYLTTNLINSKKYIGQHKGLVNESYLGSGHIFRKAIKQYGKENFNVEILDFAYNKKQLDKLEKVYIHLFDAVKSSNYYNLAIGGGVVGYCGKKKWYVWKNSF